MGRALRSEQFDPNEVSIAHVTQRCVRRAYLAGTDPVSGQDFGYRRDWIRRRMEALASVFGVDILTYAILSNHMHLILRNRPDVVKQWSDHEVAIRWLKVFPGRRLEEHLGDPTQNDVDSLVRNRDRIIEIRQRLSDFSWFMRALSEPIARMANKQDECTGRFWEGRFKTQRIVDEAGLMACAMYVDLNPVRASLADSPERSKHTSAYDRIQGAKGKEIPSAAFDLVPIPTVDAGKEIRETPVDELKERRRKTRRNPTSRQIRFDAWLAPLTLSKTRLSDDPETHRGGIRASNKGFLEITQRDYMNLLKWTAQRDREGSGKEVPKDLHPLLKNLGIDLSMWRELVWNFRRYFGQSCCAGSPTSMSHAAEQTGRRWSRGQRSVAACFTKGE